MWIIRSKGIRVVLAMGIGFVLGTAIARGRLSSVAPSQPPGITIEQVQALSSLVTQRVTVSDVVVAKLEGYAGGSEAALLVRGDFDLGIDLSAARLESVDPARHKAILYLPQPRVERPRVDHRRSRLVAMRDRGLWTLVPGGEGQVAALNLALRDGQKYVEQAAADQSLVAEARAHAERILIPWCRAAGWTLEVRFVD